MMNITRSQVSGLAAFVLLTTASAAVPPGVYPGAGRLRVLVISEPHSLPGGPAAERCLLEACTNLRFASVPVPHAGGDHALDVDGLMGKDPRMILRRRRRILSELRKSWDAIFFRPGRTKRNLDAEIQKALAGAVGRGIPLFWFDGKLEAGKRGYPEVDESLAAMLPFGQEGEAAEFKGSDPLAGLGLEEAGLGPSRRMASVGNQFAVIHTITSRRKTIPFLVYRRFGRGVVVGIQTGGGLFPTLSNEEIDGELLWARALERLLRFAKSGSVPPAVRVSVVKDEGKETVLTPGALLTLSLNGPKGVAAQIAQDDQRGGRRVLAKSVKLIGEPQEVTVTLASSPCRWQMIEAAPTSGRAHPGRTFIELQQPVDLQIETTQQGYAPDYQTSTHIALRPRTYTGQAQLTVRVVDWAGKTVGLEQQAVELVEDEAFERDFPFALEDPDTRAWVCWVRSMLTDPQGTLLAHGESKLYRYRPYDLTEKLQIATWHAEGGTTLRAYRDVFLKHLKELGFTAVFGARGLEALERSNLRLYMEHQASTRLGVGHAASFRADIAGYEARYEKEGENRATRMATRSGTSKRKWPTAALNMFSMGEESGYGRWSESYPWRNKEAAPEECNKWFRHYLQKLYDNDLAKLNEAWGKSFKNWQELKVWRKYAEPFGWMFRPPPKDLERNLTPYVDTHAFHEWHFEEYAHNMMKGLRKANPVPTWTLSYDFTFLHFPPSPVTNFYCAIPPEGVAVWHAYVRSRTPGPANPFHLDWMYYEDDAMNRQFLQMGYALGCTYLSTWGHVFNADLTPTRPGMTIARTMAKVEPVEAVVTKMQPHYDGKIGIYTFDSRWTLVRGRYGYFLHRRGPNDIAMGVGPYKAPGASYTKPPEGPLYIALTESGYAPKYVTAEEFAGCKILFLPYVEAIDEETAGKLRAYVENGGTLVATPVIAQYDAGGKPYVKYPGAGLDELFGFRAEREWIMGRYPVDFPGENAAKKAFAEAWFRSSGVERTEETEKQALERDAPLFFNMTMRIGGDPCHYLPEGHEKLSDLADDVVVIGRHEDGEPLFTYREVGKGRAICFNVLLTWPSGLQIPVTEQRETFRQAIDQLVRRLGVTPDVELINARGYGEGVVDFVTAQYDLPGTEARILSMFSDWRSRPASAKLRLHAGYTHAYDLLGGRKMVTIEDPEGVPEALVTVDPGQWRLVALTKAEPPTPGLRLAGSARQGEAVPLALTAPGDRTLYGRLTVLTPAGPSPHHSRSLAVAAGETPKLRIRLDDPAGSWRIRYRDAIAGRRVEKALRVQKGRAAEAIEKAPGYPDEQFTAARLAERGPEITDAEFVGLLERLRGCHLDPGPVDKRRYSYFTYEIDDSRQRTCQLLACADWTERLGLLRDYLARGERLYLIGEDLGYDPRSTTSTTPARRPRIMEALDALAAEDSAELLQVAGRPHLRVIRVGRGMLVLDARSPDAAGNANLHLAAFHQAWLEEMTELGLLPGGSGARFLPVGEETVKQWFFAFSR